MARPRKKFDQLHRTPKVRIASPTGRLLQLRYQCPKTKREVRISTGTDSLMEAERQKKLLEAQLLIGITPALGKVVEKDANLSWEEFREQYRQVQLRTLRQKTAIDAESRLDIAERVLRPKTLGDAANAEALHRLQSALLSGEQSRFERARSSFTVKSYMAAVMAALNWAHLQGWIPSLPRIRKLKVAKMRAMKGRPLSDDEFKLMLAAVPDVVGQAQSESWSHVLRGLWESGLRLGELMNVSWDNPNQILPRWEEGRFPILRIPASMQKNDTEEEIPLLPGFEKLLNQTKPADRKGAVFNPLPIRLKESGPLSVEHIGKIISSIGKKAQIVVHPGAVATGRSPKYASAHDLRRSCAQRMERAGVPPHVIAKILRHASWETTQRHYVPGEIQHDAAVLRNVMSVSGGSQNPSTVSEIKEKSDGQ